MPRTAKRNPAAPSSMPATSPGQDYGVAGEQRAAMAQMPLAEAAGTQVPMNQAQPPSPLPAVQAEAPAVDPETLALMMDPPPEGGALALDSAFPDEPLTAGMSIGEGPGPEAVALLGNQSRRAGPVAATLAAIAQATGDPALRQLADRAATRKV